MDSNLKLWLTSLGFKPTKRGLYWALNHRKLLPMIDPDPIKNEKVWLRKTVADMLTASDAIVKRRQEAEKASKICPRCEKKMPNVGPWNGEGGGWKELCGPCKIFITLRTPEKIRKVFGGIPGAVVIEANPPPDPRDV